MLFNPRLSRTDPNTRLAKLTAWLRPLLGDEDSNGSKQRPDPHQIVGGQMSALSGHQTEVAIALLNVLFDAAHQRILVLPILQWTPSALGGRGHAS